MAWIREGVRASLSMKQEEYTLAVAIIDALNRLETYEPLIARTAAGVVVAIYFGDDGQLREESIYGMPSH